MNENVARIKHNPTDRPRLPCFALPLQRTRPESSMSLPMHGPTTPASTAGTKKAMDIDAAETGAAMKKRKVPLTAFDDPSDKEAVLSNLQNHPLLIEACNTHGVAWDEVAMRFATRTSSFIRRLPEDMPGIIDATCEAVADEKRGLLPCDTSDSASEEESDDVDDKDAVLADLRSHPLVGEALTRYRVTWDDVEPRFASRSTAFLRRLPEVMPGIIDAVVEQVADEANVTTCDHDQRTELPIAAM